MSLYTQWQEITDKIVETNIWCNHILDHSLIFNDSMDMYYYGKNLVDHSGKNKNGVLTQSYSTSDDGIIFNGGYGRTGSLSTARGTWEIYCKVNSNFTPYNATNWYLCSCLVGCELGDTQQDFGIILNRSGNFAIGYSTSSISDSGIKGNDGQWHHLVLTVTDSNMKLYIDGALTNNISYSNKGNIPSYDGLFWNYANSSSIVRGVLGVYRHYTSVLTQQEILRLYKWTKSGNR